MIWMYGEYFCFHMRQWLLPCVFVLLLLSDRLCWDAVTILQGGVDYANGNHEWTCSEWPRKMTDFDPFCQSMQMGAGIPRGNQRILGIASLPRDRLFDFAFNPKTEHDVKPT